MGDQAGDAGEDRHAARSARPATPTSCSVAAIAIETFIGSGLPQIFGATAASRVAASTPRPAILALARQRDHPLGARVDRLVQRMAEAGERLAGRAPLARRRFGRFVGRRAGVDPRQHIIDQRAALRRAEPRMIVPQPSTPAATAPCSAAGSAA